MASPGCARASTEVCDYRSTKMIMMMMIIMVIIITKNRLDAVHPVERNINRKTVNGT